MIDVHRLAGQLGVSAEVVLRAAAELDGTVSSGAVLSDELADRIRTRLRAARGSFGGSPLFSGGTPGATSGGRQGVAGGTPGFSGGAQGHTVARPEHRSVTQAFPRIEDRPPQRGHEPATPRHVPARVGDGDSLASRLTEQAAAADLAAEWRTAGLGAHDQHIIELCQRQGLTPQDVRRRVDGQTIASRLKNGESISSIRSRIAESD